MEPYKSLLGCKPQPSSVAVRGISYNNVYGVSTGTHGVLLNCSRTVPCSAISLYNVVIVPKSQATVERVGTYSSPYDQVSQFKAQFLAAYGQKSGILPPYIKNARFSPPPIAKWRKHLIVETSQNCPNAYNIPSTWKR